METGLLCPLDSGGGGLVDLGRGCIGSASQCGAQREYNAGLNYGFAGGILPGCEPEDCDGMTFHRTREIARAAGYPYGFVNGWLNGHRIKAERGA